MEWIFLVLAVVVLAFGIGVLVVSRRRNRAVEGQPRPRAAPTTARRRRRATPTIAATRRRRTGRRSRHRSSSRSGRPRCATGWRRPVRRSPGRSPACSDAAAITDETWDELEEALLRADVGVTVTDALLDDLKTRVKAKEITEPAALLDALQADMSERLAAPIGRCIRRRRPPGARTCGCSSASTASARPPRSARSPSQQTPLGRSVLMAAGDTFRAAAAEQLGAWAERAGCELVRGDAGGDPSAVIYDGVERAAAKDIDLVLADTAGRLHTKTNLMEELRKVRRVADKGVGRVTETLLVIDATTGQNGLAQAREFGEATQVTGVVLTKLDGSAKGGIVFAIETELGIPDQAGRRRRDDRRPGRVRADRVRRRTVRPMSTISAPAGTVRVGRRPTNMRIARLRTPADPVVRVRDLDARRLWERRIGLVADRPDAAATRRRERRRIGRRHRRGGVDGVAARTRAPARPTPTGARVDARLRWLRVRGRRRPAGAADELDRLPLPGRRRPSTPPRSLASPPRSASRVSRRLPPPTAATNGGSDRRTAPRRRCSWPTTAS